MLKSLSKEMLAEIKRLAGLFFTPAEIAMMLELPGEEFKAACEIESCDEYKAYYGGLLQGQIDLRTSISKMAKAGSSPAQAMMLDILKLSKSKMIS